MVRKHSAAIVGVLAAALLSACGAAHIAKQGDELLRKGSHDAAIAKYEEALRAAKGDPAASSDVTRKLNNARATAAQHHLADGDNARDRRRLREAGAAYKRAASYTPTAQDVVQRQSDLLKQRLRIESDIDTTHKTLALLKPRGAVLKDLSKWEQLVRLVEGLQMWRHDYPAVTGLYDKVAAPAASVMLLEAERLMTVEEFDDAQVQIQKALRLQPKNAKARQLLDKAMVRGAADKLATEGHDKLEKGDVAGAVQAYEKALKRDPKSYAAKQGAREARRRFVEERLAALKKHGKSKDRRAALKAVMQAQAMGTDYPKIAKALSKHHKKLTERAAKHYYKLGRRHERKRLWGAALVNYRIAAYFGGGAKDAGKRLEKAQRKVADLRAMKLYTTGGKVPKGDFVPAADAIFSGFKQRFATSKLPARGVMLVEGRKEKKRADGRLVISIGAFSLSRASRDDERRKKYLDRVEFPANPQWAIAQSGMSATLAALNAATDAFRPVQEELNATEERLAKLDADYVKLKARISKEDGLYYQNKPAPCPDGTTNCAKSYANRRWAKHVKYYKDNIAKANGKIATLSPRFNELRDEVHKKQAEFSASEKSAYSTPKKLREEIWLDYKYTVKVHEVKFKAQLAAAWFPRKGKEPLAKTETAIDDNRVDFSTPGIVVKEQTLEPPKQSKLPDDMTLMAELTTRLLDQATAELFPKLMLQGMRFVKSAADSKKAANKLHYQVLALSTGDGISAEAKQRLLQEVLQATGYDFEKMEPVIDRLKYN